MESSCVRQTLIPGTSKLFSDFLYDFEKISAFYPYWFADPNAFREAASRIEYPEARRSALVSALRTENGDSPALDVLSGAGTVAVVTGQQVGLFSGPAYTIYKALTAIKLARQLTEHGIPAVPIFWSATEDHDLAEVDHAWVFNEQGIPRKVQLGPEYTNGGPVGNVLLGEVPIRELREGLGQLPYADEIVERVRAAYQPGATLGSAFTALLKDVLRGTGLLFINPLAPPVRELAVPFLEAAADRVQELVDALRSRNKELSARGYHSQVNVEAETSLLFVIANGKRLPLRWQDGKFVAKDRAYNPAELRDLHEKISPNALLRPVMQDYILPTVAYVGGPAEIAYMAQAQVVYEKLLGRTPVIFPRNSFTLLDTRASKLLDKHNLQIKDLLDFHQNVKAQIARTLIPGDLEDEFRRVRNSVAASLERLQSDLANFDPTLQAATKKSSAKVIYQIEKLARKTANETLRRDARASRDTEYLLNFIYPERHLQERFYSIVPFLAKSGLDLPTRLLEQTQLACPDHMVRVL